MTEPRQIRTHLVVPGPGQHYGPPPGSGGAPDRIDVKSRLAILRRYKALIVLTTVTGLGLAAFHLERQPPAYRAAASVRFSDARQSLTAGIASEAQLTDHLVSEIQILQSRRTLGTVADELGLRLVSGPDLPASAITQISVDSSAAERALEIRFGSEVVTVRDGGSTAATTYGAPVSIGGVRFAVPAPPAVASADLTVRSRNAAISELRGGLRVVPRLNTSILDVTFTAADPLRAQQLANGVATVYQQQSALAAQQQSRRRREFLESQLVQTDSSVVAAQERLSSFRRNQEVYSARERFSAQQGGLFSVDIRLQELETDRRLFSSLLASVRRAGRVPEAELRTVVSSPDIVGSPVIGPLYSQLIDYQRTRDTLTAGIFGSSRTNPDVQRLDTLIATTKDRIVAALGSQVDALDARIEALQGLRNSSATAIRELPAIEAEEVWLTQEVATMRDLSSRLRDEHQRARIAEAIAMSPVELVDAALPGSLVPVPRTRLLLFGMLAGLLGGSAAAFGLERLNTSIRRREDIERSLGIPGLAVIPQFASGAPLRRRGLRMLPFPTLAGRQPRNQRELVTVGNLTSSASEAYRTLRTNIIFSQVTQTIRRLVVTSPGPGEGKTTTSANLAVAFAQQGMRVLLIDCDLRRSHVHKVFGVSQSPGLTELVMGLAQIHEVVRVTDVPTLSVIPGGTSAPNPAELLGGTQMKAALDKLSESYDLIILDTPPVLASADASVLTAAADGAILVVRAGATDRAVALEAVQQLAGVGGRVVGCVLNDADAAMLKYGTPYYYGYYGREERPVA